MKALGGYNFAGDIGKMTVPALAALMIAVMPWRPTLIAARHGRASSRRS